MASLQTSSRRREREREREQKRGRTDLPLRGDLTHVQFDASGPQLLWPCVLRQSEMSIKRKEKREKGKQNATDTTKAK